MNILLVNTPEDLTTPLSKQLEAWGYGVVLAETDFEALQILCKQNVQLVIKDWSGADLDNSNLCKELCESEFKRFIYMIAIIGKSQNKNAFMGESALTDSYLSKPFDKKTLLDKIKTADKVIKMESKLTEDNNRSSKAHTVIKDAFSKLESEMFEAQMQLGDIEEIVLSS